MRKGFEVGDELQEYGACPIRQIDYLPSHTWSRHSQHIAMHDIVNIGEVT
jgi:hypothetical protein